MNQPAEINANDNAAEKNAQRNHIPQKNRRHDQARRPKQPKIARPAMFLVKIRDDLAPQRQPCFVFFSRFHNWTPGILHIFRSQLKPAFLERAKPLQK
jgi:hypothetical protein